jgi:hypothetical protein
MKKGAKGPLPGRMTSLGIAPAGIPSSQSKLVRVPLMAFAAGYAVIAANPGPIRQA